MTTNAADSVQDPIVNTTQGRPNVPELIEEFKRCSPAAGAGWDRSAQNDRVRFNRDISPDGKKHGTRNKEAFPFEDASDAAVPLADDICNDLVSECVEGFWRAWMLPKFGTESEEAQYGLKLADYLVNTSMQEQLFHDVELSAQYREQYGWVALQPMWVQEISLESKTITLQQIAGMGTGAGNSTTEAQSHRGGMGQMGNAGGTPALPGAAGAGTPTPEQQVYSQLAALIQDPVQEEQAIGVLHALWKQYVTGIAGTVQAFRPPVLDKQTLTTAVRELRTKGSTDMPVPYVCKDGPAVGVRKPWDEIFITSDVADVQKRRVYIRLWHDEVELAEKELSGFDPAWVREALKHKGKQSVWSSSAQGVQGNPPETIAGHSGGAASAPVTGWMAEDRKSGAVETVYCLYRALDKNRVPGVYMTVFCPHFGEGERGEGKGEKGGSGYAWHGLVKGARGEIPLVIGTRERVASNICSSRGVPEIVQTWQRQKKAQHDGLVDWLSVAVFPPINQFASAYDTKYRFGPGVRNTVMPGKEPRFMDIPTKGVPISIELLEMLGTEAKEYFGLMSRNMPQGNPSKKQRNIGSFLLLWTAAIQRLGALCLAHMKDEEFAGITGAPIGWLEANRNNPNVATKLQFDARSLDPEYALKQLDVMNKTVLPADVTNSIPRDKWTQIQLRTVSPLWAKALEQDPKGAGQRMYEQVRNDINSMFLGNEVQYVEMDPAAQIKLQYATQIVQANPNFQQALQQEGRFRELMMKYVMNLQFSLTQEQNKKIGAIGVKPEEQGGRAGI